MLADGRRLPIAELVGSTPRVLAMDVDGSIVSAQSEVVWEVGVRQVFDLVLASGRRLRATAKHRCYTYDGWRRLGDLSTGDRLALARQDADDLCWDHVVAIQSAGAASVYDLTVPGPASWLADGIVSHNSGAIEQDADLVMFIYRDEYYDPHSEKQGIAEVIIGKQRNGPVGSVDLQFHNAHVRFNDLARSAGD